MRIIFGLECERFRHDAVDVNSGDGDDNACAILSLLLLLLYRLLMLLLLLGCCCCGSCNEGCDWLGASALGLGVAVEE